MDLETIIDEVADEADTILAGISVRKDARASLSEHIRANHPELPPDDLLLVVRGVMNILNQEDFFQADSTRTESIWGEETEGADPAET